MSEINFSDYFYYDETSPSCLRWKVNRYSGKYSNIVAAAAHSPVDTINHAGYYIGMLFRKVVRVHRVIWQLFNGSIPKGYIIDHIDRDKTNNKISNLRLATTKTNGQNCKKQSNNTSGITGVYKSCHNGCCYWKAGWQDGPKWKDKSFSINKLGNETAFRMACKYRSMMIHLLNQAGESYSDAHGT